MHSRDLINAIKNIVKSIYKELGVGLPFSIYETCIIYELSKLDILVEKDVNIPVKYKELHFDRGFTADLYVDNQLIIGLNKKKMDENIYVKHIENYMRLGNCSSGIFINFNASHIDNCVLVVEKKPNGVVSAPIPFSSLYYNRYTKKTHK